MIKHKKQYENVFSEDRDGSRTRLNLDEVRFLEMDVDEYISTFTEFLRDFYNNLFLDCVKLSWLRRKFIYYNNKISLPAYKNSFIVTNAFVKFLRRVIGKDIQIITKGPFFTKLESYYFDEMFPDFEEGNPFKNPDYYKFPYKNISLDYLLVIYQLDDRFEILKEADEKKMNYAEFLDYVINHIYSENDRLKKDRYIFKINKNNTKKTHYVIDTEKKLAAKLGKKRL